MRHNPDLLNVPEAAQYIHRSKDFVRRQLRYDIPVHQYKDRGELFFDRLDLDVWIARHTHVPAR